MGFSPTQSHNINRAPLEGSPESKPAPKKQQDVDFYSVIFCLLVEAASIQNEKNIIGAKQQEANVKEQQEYNNKDKQLGWVYIPNEEINHHTQCTKHKGYKRVVVTYRYVKKGNGHMMTVRKTEIKPYTYYTYKKHTTIGNEVDIEHAKVENGNRETERQVFTDRLATLNQLGQRQSTEQQTNLNEVVQTTQEGSNLLDVVKKASNDICIN